jgi:predicted kinase
VERKRLFGLAPLAHSGSRAGNIYDASATGRTYSRLHELARNLLAAGTTVVVDAAFLKQDERDRFRLLAHEMSAPFAIVAMRVSSASLRARITQRQRESNDASEADLAVLELLQAKQEALSPVEQARTVEFANEEAGIEADVSSWKKLNHLVFAS